MLTTTIKKLDFYSNTIQKNYKFMLFIGNIYVYERKNFFLSNMTFFCSAVGMMFVPIRFFKTYPCTRVWSESRFENNTFCCACISSSDDHGRLWWSNKIVFRVCFKIQSSSCVEIVLLCLIMFTTKDKEINV